MVPKIKTRLVIQTPWESPIGRFTQAGYLEANRGLRRSTMRVLGTYGLVYLIGGQGRFRDVLGTDQPVHAGNMLVLFPDIGHTYGPAEGQTWSEVYICFDGPVFEVWRKKGLLLDASRPIRQLQPIEYWLRRFEQILESPASTDPEQTLARICKVQQMLADMVIHERRSIVAEEDRAWLNTARQLLERTVDGGSRGDELNLELAAAHMHMSYAGFRKKFARLAGIPPAKYHMRRVMDRACELIFRDRQLTNKEVACQCGFCDEFHFSRRFKQVVGLSPREFRKNLPGGAT